MLIAVIPARGGSKGIRRKNLRLLNAKPLISYVLEASIASRKIDAVIVTTDDYEIAEYCKQFNVIIRERPKHLGKDSVPLDPVVSDSVQWFEEHYSANVETVITIQPTSPLITSSLIDEAIDNFFAQDLDSLISVVDNTHLGWKIENNELKPDYKKRLNRQWLPKRFKETGAFVISKREIINSGTRIGGKVGIYEVPLEASIDLDSPNDWLLCSALLKRLSVKFVVTGNSNTGMGHIYRTLTLADFWLGHNIEFILYQCSSKAKKIITERGYKHNEVVTLEEIIKYIKPFDIIINDILDTDSKYIEKLISKGCFVVNFEDLGTGADQANLVINALYERFDPPFSHRYGYKYVCLRDDFLLQAPNTFSDCVRSVLITFGGVDPTDLTFRTLKALEKIDPKINVKLVIGPSYRAIDKLGQYIKEHWGNRNLEVMRNVKNMAKVMRNVDLAITSNGRTVYELAAMRIPMISIAQNDRETMHLFARYSEGIKYLGVSCNVDEETIYKNVVELINDSSKRKKMFDNLPYKEIRRGIFNVTDLIESEYRRWKHERDSNREF
ncbi:cytidylyltransferase domain-containing protein [Kosmotoga olearia]|nr:hypothetical protein [Kosmotoga olearia]